MAVKGIVPQPTSGLAVGLAGAAEGMRGIVRGKDKIEDQRRYDETLAEGQRQFDTTTEARRREFDKSFTEGKRQFGETHEEGQRQFDTSTAQSESHFSRGLGENQRQFDENDKWRRYNLAQLLDDNQIQRSHEFRTTKYREGAETGRTAMRERGATHRENLGLSFQREQQASINAERADQLRPVQTVKNILQQAGVPFKDMSVDQVNNAYVEFLKSKGIDPKQADYVEEAGDPKELIEAEKSALWTEFTDLMKDPEAAEQRIIDTRTSMVEEGSEAQARGTAQGQEDVRADSLDARAKEAEKMQDIQIEGEMKLRDILSDAKGSKGALAAATPGEARSGAGPRVKMIDVYDNFNTVTNTWDLSEENATKLFGENAPEVKSLNTRANAIAANYLNTPGLVDSIIAGGMDSDQGKLLIRDLRETVEREVEMTVGTPKNPSEEFAHYDPQVRQIIHDATMSNVDNIIGQQFLSKVGTGMGYSREFVEEVGDLQLLMQMDANRQMQGQDITDVENQFRQAQSKQK